LSRRSVSAALLAAVFAVLATTPALAVPVPMGGSPLNVIVGDQGQLQAFRQDRTDATQPPGIFYQPRTELGDAGFFLAFPTTAAPANPAALEETVWGFGGSAGPGLSDTYTNTSQGGVTGSGTAADPLTQVSVYVVRSATPSDFARVTQTTTYVNGSQEFRVHWDVTNLQPTPLRFKALAAADFFFEGDDAGVGIFTQGPPRFIGGTNVDSGSSGGFVEVSPAWDAYQALDFPTVWSKVRGAAADTNPVWDNSVLDHPDDNAGGVEWDQGLTTPLNNGQTRSFDLIIRSAVPSALQLTPTNAASRQGVPVGITATATDSNGQPYAGKTLRYTIAGPNATTGSATLGPTGSAVITDPGTNPGTDSVTVFVDFNNDGVRQSVEPVATALATFVDSVPPTCSLKASGTLIGGGASGKPLVITLTCGEGATVTVATTLTAPAARRAVASAKKKKAKKIKLKPVKQTVGAGQPTKLRVKIPKSIARKYAGKTLTATMTITAKDTAGNVKKTTIKRKVKLAKLRKKTRSRRG
jgi:hypothetical protein